MRGSRRPAIFFGFEPWKDYVSGWFPNRDCKVVSRNPPDMLRGGWPLRLLLYRSAEVFVWGFKYPPFLKWFCRRFGIPFYHVEDGFVRSVLLGAQRSPPASLIIDSRTLHYDARNASDLENTLQTYDFAADKALMERADRCIRMLLDLRISKYNLGKRVSLDTLLGPKTRRRVLVLGQVETDASIAFGCNRAVTNNDLVRLAASENPDAQIIYKPHPEVLHGTRTGVSDPAEVADVCDILKEDIAPADALEGIDHVYTITSLMGFEALLWGVPVTCFGMPFYAGWGVTDDRQVCARRTRRLTVQEIFAAAYLLRSRYLGTLEQADFEAVIHRLNKQRV
ncbi:capsular polysaccharide biosynthesis protein [Sinorhizobium medicae]|uniref:capsular polysaccharide export protein, LipB/KpsS family n=1 Tax=Sinorhizobium medicae TaxID=110321 RepID=UPI00129717CC|nr:capsular polysaccharide biosynthesis protein [Sinorhizobium medicae]MDX0480034.1 capsular polysaccharide biosynthesis protein [Sinorhizobium medicae]MDX0751366.1 capsular polysaccharide biosynthesis protein [Sinorhizobium medicae]MDX0899355.1 capsular polysaccharide biosynthesis protein [Sinorhizobium medicae]MDX1118123.1 capsular polysaccharide biosynthesis protein [Sinorhizobium medicae]MDX1242034.1 capsular polysaccharide biosynthesis protein [Sinorhizobium medicae]